MPLEDEIKAYDQRQIKVMLQRLNYCKCSKVSEEIAIDLISLCDLLNNVDPEWKNKFLRLCYKLDYLYGIAGAEERLVLNVDEKKECDELIAALKKLVMPLIIETVDM